jgi:hypothetical protein
VPNLSLAGPDPDEEKLVTVAATKCLTESGDVYGTRPLWEQLRAALDEKLKGRYRVSVCCCVRCFVRE